jgi:malate dehydrogenase (oxaloacetate-decarboxylating)(NADP+)
MNDENLDAWIKAHMYDPHSEVQALEREVGALLSNLGPASPALNGYYEDQTKDAKL